MIHDEAHYEVLAALAAAGQLCDTELIELERHATHCASCTQCLAEMAAIGRQLFLFQARTSKGLTPPAGMQERFATRFMNAGVPLRRRLPAFRYTQALRLASVVALLIVVALLSKRLPVKTLPVTSVAASSIVPGGSAPGLQPTAIAESREPPVAARPAQRRRFRRAAAHGQTHVLTFASSADNWTKGRARFSLDPVLFSGNAGTPLRFSSNPGRFPFIAADNSTSETALQSNQRLFHLNATVAFLSPLAYQPDLKSRARLPDFSMNSVFNPARSR